MLFGRKLLAPHREANSVTNLWGHVSSVEFYSCEASVISSYCSSLFQLIDTGSPFFLFGSKYPSADERRERNGSRSLMGAIALAAG
jgi:hypothetical protein